MDSPKKIKKKKERLILSLSFYQREDTLCLAKELIGKFLFTSIEGKLCGGMIVETESYLGAHDRASHAYRGRKTKRTQIMFEAGGVAYIYLCYGIHCLFNIVTNQMGVPHAILIRAIEPIYGIDVMLQRRNKKELHPSLTKGPGALAAALGLKVKHTGVSLSGPSIWLEDRGIQIKEQDLIASPRIGIGYAKEDALLPYRFHLKNSPWASKANICKS